MNKNDFEKEYTQEISDLKKLLSNLEQTTIKEPKLEDVRAFVRISKAEIEDKKKRNYNIFRAIALATLSVLVPAMHFYPLQVASISLLSIIIMPIVLVFSKEEQI